MPPHHAAHEIRSLIHYRDLYSTSLRLLLGCAADPSMAKKNSFKARVEVVRMDRGYSRSAPMV